MANPMEEFTSHLPEYYDLTLESEASSEATVEYVREIPSPEPKDGSDASSSASSSGSSDSATVSMEQKRFTLDDIFVDVEKVSMILATSSFQCMVDANEVFEQLEALRDDPYRVEVVAKNILAQATQERVNEEVAETVHEDIPVNDEAYNANDLQDVAFERDIETVISILPYADRAEVHRLLTNHWGNVDEVVDILLSRQNPVSVADENAPEAELQRTVTDDVMGFANDGDVHYTVPYSKLHHKRKSNEPEFWDRPPKVNRTGIEEESAVHNYAHVEAVPGTSGFASFFAAEADVPDVANLISFESDEEPDAANPDFHMEALSDARLESALRKVTKWRGILNDRLEKVAHRVRHQGDFKDRLHERKYRDQESLAETRDQESLAELSELESLAETSAAFANAAKEVPGTSGLASLPIQSDLPSSSSHHSLDSIERSDDIDNDFQNLKEIFIDADPDYLLGVVHECYGKPDALKEVVLRFLEKRDYPKLKDTMAQKAILKIKEECLNRVITPQELLDIFEDPFETFYNESRPVSANYREHAFAQLVNDFRSLRIGYIQRVLRSHNYHYSPSVKELREAIASNIAITKKTKSSAHMLPDNPDEFFYKELSFVKIEDDVRKYIKEKEETRKSKIEDARSTGNFVTCGCCFDDECLLEEMALCDDGHMFCAECIQRGTDFVLGQGKAGLECLAGGCQKQFLLSILQRFLKPKTFSSLLKRVQQEEIRQANLEDLETCRFCEFAAIIANPDDKVFRCLNPDCLKETCRLCGEDNHIPLRCDEVEKEIETKMRTAIEDGMTQALVRICYKCNRSFVKEDGCNKMTCVCGASMCYVCRQPIKDYTHFGTAPGKCPQQSDTELLHHQEIVSGATTAQNTFVMEHPEMKAVKLKNNPAENIQLVRGNPHPRVHHVHFQFGPPQHIIQPAHMPHPPFHPLPPILPFPPNLPPM